MDPHALEVLEFPAIRDRLAALCETQMGSSVARALAPTSSRKRLETSLRQTGEARALVDAREPLRVGDVPDLRALIDAAHDDNRPLEPVELVGLSRAVRRGRELSEFLKAREKRAPSLFRLADQFVDLTPLVREIDEAVEAPGEVVDRASTRLWDVRKAIRRTEDEVRERLDAIVRRPKVKPALQNPSPSLRNGRFVLQVKLDMKGRVPGILHDHSQTGATVFIEPSDIVDDSNRLRELRLEETKEINRILWELTRKALAQRAALRHTTDLLAWFDFTAAKARFSREGDMRAPELVKDGTLRLAGARHPVLEATVGRDAVVPLDVRLGESFKILVITGPNTGGKTLTLKTVGLLQIMFQSGLHVPVDDGSRMPVYSGIHADIGDEQSITQSLSTFSGHIRNIATILREADQKTLVLLDELGAGTDPAEGAALGTAILDELRGRGASCVVTTHLGSLKDFAFSNADVENACVEFDRASMRPTFRLLIGQPGNSNALEIARRHGIPEALLENARQAVEGQGPGAEEYIEKLVASRVALEETRKESERALGHSRDLVAEAEERLRDVEARGRRLEREAEDLVDEVLRGLLAKADPLMRELRSVPKNLVSSWEKLGEVLEGSLRESSLGKRRRDFIAGLRREDRVFVPRFDQVCRVRKIDRTEEKLTVFVGTMTVEIGYDDVSWLAPPPSESGS